jgi:RNA polymerase sigma factor (sigma-70 family)
MADHGRKARAGRPGAPSDLTLLAQAALTGSSDARDRFLVACRQYAYAAAIRFGRKHNGAEDSAQDAVIAVHGLLKTTPPDLKPQTVGALVSVLVLRSARAVAARRARGASTSAQIATAREAPDPAVEVETAEWASAVRDVVEDLPQLLRRLIDLRYGEDLSTREIAQVVGASQRTIIRLLPEAEAAVKGKLRGLDRGDDEGGDTNPRARGHP